MAHEIIRSEIDMANKHRVWCEVDGETVMLKFQEEPTEAEIKEELE